MLAFKTCELAEVKTAPAACSFAVGCIEELTVDEDVAALIGAAD